MTKANEIAILRSAVELLGDNSYCGPWLASVVDEVESTIRSDYFPTNTLAEATEEARLVIEAAATEANNKIVQALADAKKITDRAGRYQDSVAQALNLALYNLTSV